MDFKQLVLDVLTEEVLTSKCKFQPGDVVIIRTAYRAATRPFVNTIAKIENDRQTGNQLVLYKVKVNDGTSHYVSSSRLDGPFLDVKTAKKYLDPNITIDSSDILKRYTILDTWQTRQNAEAQLKNILTAPPFNFIWNDAPNQVEQAYSNTVSFTLAQSPLADDINLQRYNSSKTKKLTSEAYRITLPPINILLSVLQSRHSRLWHDTTSSSGFLKTVEMYKQSFKAMEIIGYDLSNPSKIIITNSMLKRVLEECPLLNFFKDKPNIYKPANDSIYLDNVDINAFKGIPINNLQVVCTKDGNLVGCPEVVHGDFEVVGYDKLRSLEGCPRYIGGDFTLNTLTSEDKHNVDLLSHFPEHIGGTFKCPRLDRDEAQQLDAFIRRKKALADIEDEARNDPGLSDLF